MKVVGSRENTKRMSEKTNPLPGRPGKRGVVRPKGLTGRTRSRRMKISTLKTDLPGNGLRIRGREFHTAKMKEVWSLITGKEG